MVINQTLRIQINQRGECDQVSNATFAVIDGTLFIYVAEKTVRAYARGSWIRIDCDATAKPAFNLI